MIRQLFSYVAATVLMTSPWLMRPGASVSQAQQVKVPVTTEQGQPEQPRRLELNLTISEPQELKVKEGETVTTGQVLSVRTLERRRLDQQKQQLELALKKLSVRLPEISPPPPPPPVAKLPKAQFSQELAAIALAENTLESKLLATQLQREKVRQLQALANIPEIVLEHEQALLATKVQEEKRVTLELESKKSRLETAQTDRAYKEYLHQIELSRQAAQYAQRVASYEQQLIIRAERERQLEYQRATIESKIQSIDDKIAQIPQVKSPFPGQVRKVRWLPSRDNNLVVQLVIVPESQRPTSRVEPKLPGNPNENTTITLPGVKPKLPGNPDENSLRPFS